MTKKKKSKKHETWRRDFSNDPKYIVAKDKNIVKVFLKEMERMFKEYKHFAKYTHYDSYKFITAMRNLKSDVDTYIEQELEYKIKTLEDKNRETVE